MKAPAKIRTIQKTKHWTIRETAEELIITRHSTARRWRFAERTYRKPITLASRDRLRRLVGIPKTTPRRSRTP